MKRFIEDDFEVDFTTPLNFVKSFVVMSLIAPYKLVTTVSSKIFYLPKRAIERVLLNSTIIGIAITVLNAGLLIYFNRFSLFYGRIPIIVMIVGSVFLLALYVVFKAGNFTAVMQFNELFPEEQPQQEEQGETPQSAQQQAPQPTQAPQQAPPPQQAQPQPAQQEAPQSKEVNLPDLKKNDKISKIGNFVGLNMESESGNRFLAAMRQSSESSEFLSEALLVKFAKDVEIVDTINLEEIGLGVIPNSFKALV